MNKKVLILSGSPRRKGNSDLLCDEFMKGAMESGNEVEKIFIRDKKIQYCIGCYYCEKNDGICFIKDAMSEILKKIHWADVIVMSSPVYFYSIDAQMKALIDRCVAQWTKIKNKEFYYIMTSAENSDTVMDCTLECFRGFARCLEGSVEKGVIYGKGFYKAGEVMDSQDMIDAYNMGKSV